MTETFMLIELKQTNYFDNYKKMKNLKRLTTYTFDCNKTHQEILDNHYSTDSFKLVLNSKDYLMDPSARYLDEYYVQITNISENIFTIEEPILASPFRFNKYFDGVDYLALYSENRFKKTGVIGKEVYMAEVYDGVNNNGRYLSKFMINWNDLTKKEDFLHTILSTIVGVVFKGHGKPIKIDNI
jgi:hypothetical protein